MEQFDSAGVLGTGALHRPGRNYFWMATGSNHCPDAITPSGSVVSQQASTVQDSELHFWKYENFQMRIFYSCVFIAFLALLDSVNRAKNAMNTHE